MSKTRRVVPLAIVPRVTAKYGEVFARVWLHEALRSGDLFEAFASTEIIGWPEDENERAIARRNEIENEILKRIVEALRPVIEREFLRIARAVLIRERTKQK